jgi:hypothetical protein
VADGERRRVATLEDAIQLRADYYEYGSAFVDADGRRIAPDLVVVTREGATTTEDGAPAYRPEPLNLAEEDGR